MASKNIRSLYLAPGVFKKNLKGQAHRVGGLLVLFDEIDKPYVIKKMTELVDLQCKKIVQTKDHKQSCISKRLSKQNNFLIFKN